MKTRSSNLQSYSRAEPNKQWLNKLWFNKLWPNKQRPNKSWPNMSVITLLVGQTALLTGHTVQAEEFIPQPTAHAKPSPFAVMPLYDLGQPGGEMPYVQEQANPTAGAIDTVTGSKTHNVIVGSSYNSATNGNETFADLRKKTSQFYGRAIVVVESADGYKGASGEDVRYGYDRQAGQFVVGATPRSSTDVKLVYVRDIIKDNKNPTVNGVPYANGSVVVAQGFGVDPVNTDRQVGKLIWDEKFNGDVVNDMQLEIYSVSLERTADNYSLRDTQLPKQQRAEVDRTMTGLKAQTNVNIFDSKTNVSVHYSDINHNAKRYGGPKTPGLSQVTAYHYPGVEMGEWLLAGTSTFDVAKHQTLSLGVNYKHVKADATKAHLATSTPNSGNMSAQDLYRYYYGDVDLYQSEGHGSAKLQWDYDNQSDLAAYLSVANFTRSPDTQERYFAAPSFVGVTGSPMGTSARAVGNPDINWEQHRRVEAGVTQSSSAWVDYGRTRGHGLSWQWNVTAYHDDIKDFITRDRARGQTDTGAADYARIWRNVDATMAGVDIDVKANLTKKLASRLALNFVDGKNTSDDRALYYVAPFEANLFFDYFDYLSTGGTWNLGTQIRYVAAQNDVDDDPTTGSGFDAGETDSFTVINLYASAQVSDRVGVKIGVNNLTNKSYTDSMAKFSLEGNRVLVEAPERNFYAAVTANF